MIAAFAGVSSGVTPRPSTEAAFKNESTAKLKSMTTRTTDPVLFGTAFATLL